MLAFCISLPSFLIIPLSYSPPPLISPPPSLSDLRICGLMTPLVLILCTRGGAYMSMAFLLISSILRLKMSNVLLKPGKQSTLGIDTKKLRRSKKKLLPFNILTKVTPILLLIMLYMWNLMLGCKGMKFFGCKNLKING